VAKPLTSSGMMVHYRNRSSFRTVARRWHIGAVGRHPIIVPRGPGPAGHTPQFPTCKRSLPRVVVFDNTHPDNGVVSTRDSQPKL
jgi:hypothetical protein